MNEYCFLPKLEEWLDITEYEGIYKVSDYGRVKSLCRHINHSKGGKCLIKEKILKQGIEATGRSNVSLRKNLESKTHKVHKLVAIAFLNHTPNGHKIVVDHIDNDKTNNILSNLQLITQRENCSKDRRGTSKYTGICWCKKNKKWVSQIRINGKLKYLGLFTEEIEASEKYQKELSYLI